MTLPYLKQNGDRYKSEYRDKRVIMYQILYHMKKRLHTGRQRSSSSIIIHSCRISAEQFKEYVTYMLQKGLIEKVEAAHQRRNQKNNIIYHYMITSKGFKYIELIEKMKTLFENDSNSFIFPRNLEGND